MCSLSPDVHRADAESTRAGWPGRWLGLRRPRTQAESPGVQCPDPAFTGEHRDCDERCLHNASNCPAEAGHYTVKATTTLHSESRCGAWCGAPGRTVRNFLEVRAGHEARREILRIFDHRRHDQPGVTVGLVGAVEVLGHPSVRAIGDAVPPQVARPQVGRDDAKRSAARRASAAAASACGLPVRRGGALPGRLTPLCGRGEVQQPRLLYPPRSRPSAWCRCPT